MGVIESMDGWWRRWHWLSNPVHFSVCAVLWRGGDYKEVYTRLIRTSWCGLHVLWSQFFPSSPSVSCTAHMIWKVGFYVVEVVVVVMSAVMRLQYRTTAVLGVGGLTSHLSAVFLVVRWFMQMLLILFMLTYMLLLCAYWFSVPAAAKSCSNVSNLKDTDSAPLTCTFYVDNNTTKSNFSLDHFDDFGSKGNVLIIKVMFLKKSKMYFHNVKQFLC